MDAVTAVTFKFTPAKESAKKYAYRWSLPPAVIASPDFQAWARGAGGGVVCSLHQLRARLKAFAELS
jgi:hypothetical protein